MQRVLFHSTIFGPIHSRRLGSSLGINLTPNDGKICSFDCLYCEAGLNAQGAGTTGMADADTVAADLETRLAGMKASGEPLDVITFSGNGEPTLHRDFERIVADTRRLRDKYFPDVKISVLSNATQLHRPDVVRALITVDNNILKLDSAVDDTVRVLDRPASTAYSVDDVVGSMQRFNGHCIVQTMMITGTFDGKAFDNTTDAEIEALCRAYARIRPASVMLYSIDRKTPVDTLQRVPADRLRDIAAHITSATGIPVTTA